MNPPKTQNGPGGSRHSRQGQYDQKAAKDIPTVQPAPDTRHASRQTELPERNRVAHVSLYAPHRDRRTWWFAYRCEHCTYGHTGQLRHAVDEESAVEAVKGRRYSLCGKHLWFVVARVYRGNEGVAA